MLIKRLGKAVAWSLLHGCRSDDAAAPAVPDADGPIAKTPAAVRQDPSGGAPAPQQPWLRTRLKCMCCPRHVQHLHNRSAGRPKPQGDRAWSGARCGVSCVEPARGCAAECTGSRARGSTAAAARASTTERARPVRGWAGPAALTSRPAGGDRPGARRKPRCGPAAGPGARRGHGDRHAHAAAGSAPLRRHRPVHRI